MRPYQLKLFIVPLPITVRHVCEFEVTGDKTPSSLTSSIPLGLLFTRRDVFHESESRLTGAQVPRSEPIGLPESGREDG